MKVPLDICIFAHLIFETPMKECTKIFLLLMFNLKDGHTVLDSSMTQC